MTESQIILEDKLNFFGRFRSSILGGTKRISIREGKRYFKTNITVFEFHAVVNYQYHCKFEQVPFSYFQYEGWINIEEALKGIREVYPNMNLDSEVTVIEFRLVIPHQRENE